MSRKSSTASCTAEPPSAFAARPNRQPSRGAPNPPPHPRQPANTPPNPPAAAAIVWEPWERARKTAQAKPDDFAAVIQLFQDAEKGAPPGLIPDIRHDKLQVERHRDA